MERQVEPVALWTLETGPVSDRDQILVAELFYYPVVQNLLNASEQGIEVAVVSYLVDSKNFQLQLGVKFVPT